MASRDYRSIRNDLTARQYALMQIGTCWVTVAQLHRRRPWYPASAWGHLIRRMWQAGLLDRRQRQASPADMQSRYEYASKGNGHD
jgi:hypothetical protein